MLLPVAALLLAALPLHAQSGTRTLTGKVTDAGHEALKGAIVKLQNETTGEVVTFISQRDGGYSFKRLYADSDYHVWASYRGKESKKEEMSHFDSKPEKVIDLVIRLD